MFIVYFALWVILNGKWTTEIGIFGVIFAAALYAFSCRFMGYGFKKDLHYLRRLPTTICYGATLLSEIFKANVTVMKMILDKNFEPQPQLVHFESGLKETRHRVVLADSITLTPGTITCQLEGDRYLVHCLDESLVSGLDDGHDHLPAEGRPLSGALPRRGDGGRTGQRRLCGKALSNGAEAGIYGRFRDRRGRAGRGEARGDSGGLRGGACRTKPAGSGEGGRA